MKAFIALFAGLAVSAAAHAAEPLLTPQQLQSILPNAQVRVIDIRDPQSYAQNHIPGAVNAPYGQWRGPASSPGELPPLTKLAELVQALGLDPSVHAVVVSKGTDATDFGAAARVYWTLKLLGLKELSLLNGGVQSWAQAGLLQDTATVAVTPTTWQPVFDTTLLATKDQVVQHVKQGSSLLIDARPANFFNGETRAPTATVPGTLPGAVNVQHDTWFNKGSGVFVSPDQARQIAASQPVDPSKETVSFCNTGHWAATNWFALSEVLGQPNVKLYPGSMAEWSQDPNALPMANVPSRVDQLLIDAKMWANRTFN